MTKPREPSRGQGRLLDHFELPAVVGDTPHIRYAELVSHPRLPDARRLFLERFVALYGDDPFLARLLIEAGRFLVFIVALLLDAAQDPARRETWFTVGRLKQELAQFGLASARQVDHLVGRLCSVDFLTLRPSEHDRRVRILATTERMRAHDRAWLAAHYAPLALLCPDNDYGLITAGDPGFQLHHRRTGLAFLPLSAKLLLAVPEMMLFFERAAGHVVLAALLQAAMTAPDGLAAALPYADAGDRFGVSRTHVRQLLAAAAAAGLVRLHARGGRQVEILPRLWQSFDRGIATGMYIHDLVYAVATGRRGACQPPPARP